MNPELKFLNQGPEDGNDKLTFDVSGYAVAPDGSNAWGVGDFRNLILGLTGTGNIKVYGSCQRLPPNFANPSTIDNLYTPITLADLSLSGSASYLDGATGITVTAETKIAEINTNRLTWIAIVRTVNTVEAIVTVTNNA